MRAVPSVRTLAGRLIVALLALATLAGAGCAGGTVKMWADTATPLGDMSTVRHQWAYDGEPVTFEIECSPGINYVVFGVSGDETVVEESSNLGKFSYTRSFKAGPKPIDYVVYANAYVVRGRRDYYYDSVEKAWRYHPRIGDRLDVGVYWERTIRVTCYRREIHARFMGHGGPPQSVELSLTKASGEPIAIPRAAESPAQRGFQLLGPDPKGAYEVSYSPTYKELSRSGTTEVDVLVTHADGSKDRIRQSLDTP
jgi:hypothetical protein